MSAGVLGGRLLAEVQEEGLHKFLDDLRKLSDLQVNSVLGLTHLDRLLKIFRNPVLSSAARDAGRTSPVPDERTSRSGVGHVASARGHTAILLAKSRLKPSTIQLTDKNSAAGKTSLCYLITTLAVLPLNYAGKRHEVVWLDTDGRFSATRLQSVLINHLSVKFPKLSSCESNSICSEALQHVNIFRPQSSSQLVSTLASLPGYLLGSGGSGGSAAYFSSSRSLGLIVLDSATAFYWQDRFEADLARFEALGTDESAGVRSHAQSSRTLEVIAELKKLQKLFDCTILFTSTPYVKSSIGTAFTAADIITNDGRLLPQEQPRVSPWTGFATLSLSVSHDRVRRFAAQISPEDCERDQMHRVAAVAKGHSIVSADWSMSDTWASGVRDTMNGLDGLGSFGIRITSLGIATDE